MKKIYILLIVSLLSFGSQAQDEYINKPDGFISLGWAPAWGVGDLGDFITTKSYRGFFFEGKKFLNSNFAVGGTIGWSGFYEIKDRATLNFDDVESIKASGAVTGNLANYYYNFPIMVSFNYYPKPELWVKPYIGFYTGTVYNRLESYLGTVGLYDETWQFQVAPEVGVFVPFGKDAEFGLHIAGRYNYVTYQKYRFNGLTYMQLNVGFSWLL